MRALFRHRLTLLIAAAIPAIAGALLLAMRVPAASSPEATSEPAEAIAPPPIVAARFVCSFANSDAKAALVHGADGGHSVVAGGRTHWLFGDTLFLAQSGKQIEANTIASSDGVDASGCPDLEYYKRDGIAVPFLEKDGSLTVWPSGAIANDDGSFDVFIVYVYGSGPYAYWIGEVGIARVDPATMQVTMRERRLFDAESGFRSQIIAAQPVDEDGDGNLRVVLQADDGEKLLARVPRASMHAGSAYEYWDGGAWSADPAAAVALWAMPPTDDPIAQLAAFEGSINIDWSDTFDAYVALTNAGHAAVGVRFAERLEGPWSEIVPWMDCDAIAQPRAPVCYAPSLHPQLSDGGRLFVTLTRFGEYDVVAYELTPGAPVHEYRHGDAIAYGFEPPAGEWQDLGVAFHASRTPAEGLSAIYRWQRGEEVAFAAASPGEGFVQGDLAFYAPLAPAGRESPIELRPVFAWSDGAADGGAHVLSTMAGGLEHYGLTRGDIAFYAPRRPTD